MTKLKVHHQGWVALPESFCQKLGVESGSEIEAELVADTIVLRSAKRVTKAAKVPEDVTAAAEAMPTPSVLAAPAQEDVPTAPAPKRRGRPPKARPVGG